MGNCADGRIFSFGSTSAVGQYPPNPFGLVDVVGNVWEWCHDRWHETLRGIPDDGSSSEEGDERRACASRRFLAGGPQLLRVLTRLWCPPDYRGDDVGFRCVRDA